MGPSEATLKNHLAFVTGATGGIGSAIATMLAKSGSDLILAGRNDEKLQSLASELRAQFKIKVTPLSFDVADYESCKRAIQSEIKTIKNVNSLIQCAGITNSAKSLFEYTSDEIDDVIKSNLSGMLYLIQIMTPFMIENSSGHLINIGSVAGRWNSPKNGLYDTTKNAATTITEDLRLDLLGTGLRVTNILPGLVDTPFREKRIGAERAKRIFEGIRLLDPKDVAEAVLWVIQRPSHVNVQELVLFPTDQAGVGYVAKSKTPKS